MILQQLSLTNFKNIPQATLLFSPNINCLLGDNGMGKSNLLDAIYYLSFTKSFTGVTDARLIRRDETFAMIRGLYLRHDIPEELQVGMTVGRRKTFRRGGKDYKRLSAHIGLFPLVMISPADMDLVNGSGEERRRFMDMVICQTDPQYMDMLIRYQQALEQRNRMLRDAVSDPNLYQAVEIQMDMAAEVICRTRRVWIDRLSTLFDEYYRLIAGNGEHPSLTYQSHMAEQGVTLSALLDERRGRDTILKYTSAGPHRDDIEMMLDDMPVRRTASQGQAKTYTIAMRMAQYDFLRTNVGITPILLLDDIFDKLDAVRVGRIMELVGSERFGQIFITDTNRKHLDEILSHAPGECAMWTVADGTFSRLTPTLPIL